MSYTFLELQNEVKARSILNESSTEFDVQVKNAINTSLFRVSREANFRQLRKKTTFDTVKEYNTGTGAVSVSNGSKSVTVTGATFITDGVQIGRLIDIGAGQKPYTIKTITGETTLTLDRNYDGSTATDETYIIYGQEEYVTNIQAGRIAIMWHEDYGYPYTMRYITDSDFYSINLSRKDRNTPIVWRQWGFDSAINQPRQPQQLSVVSSSSSDQNVPITIYGIVSGYPDQETISTNSSDGTTEVTTTKSFDSVERVVKGNTTVGRITISADSGSTIISVIVAGGLGAMTEYLKIQIFPYPTRIFPINVQYYKDPYSLVGSNDMHELGHEFDEAIILLTSAKLTYSQDKSVGDKFFALYADEIKSLKRKNADIISNYQPHMRRAGHNMYSGGGVSRYLGYSQLGGNYGPTSYR